MGFMSLLGELISTLLEKDPGDEIESTHSKFVTSIVDTLKSAKASNEDTLQALRDLGAVVYVDDVESHQLVLDSMPLLLVMFTSRQTSTQMTVQLLRTLSLVCHRNRVAQNQFHANRDARQKLVELIESSQLRRVAVAFLYHLILDNAKLLSYWAGDKRMVDALVAASSEPRAWKGWSCNLAELLLKLLAKTFL